MRIVLISILMVLLSGLTGLSKAGVPEPGILSGLFSVSDSKQVSFSKGNLQFNNTTAAVRFAANQWDYLGDVEGNLFGPGWSDLFSLSQGNEACQALNNSGNYSRTWRSLSAEEWLYLFNIRNTESGFRYAKAQVNSVNGMILLPDDWSGSYYSLENINKEDADYSGNAITASQWNTLESHGAVFLPAAGCRFFGFLDGWNVYDIGTMGYYQSSTLSPGNMLACGFSNYSVSPQYHDYPNTGISMRLVSDVLVTISMGIGAGWNWFSSPIFLDETQFEELKEALATGSTSVVIKSQNDGFATYGAEGWSGQLMSLSNSQMYLMMADHDLTLSLTGERVDLNHCQVTLKSGWNWIGYPLEDELPLDQAFVYFTPADGDMIKGQSSYASYDASEGVWQGSLESMTPEEGYLYLSNRVENVSFFFPSLKNFKPYLADSIPQGGLNGVFSLSENTKVFFSKGNLQFIGSATPSYWKFADHQWDCIGDTGQGSNSQKKDRDLFGWGTSGYNHGANSYQPWSTSQTSSDYCAYGSSSYHLYDETGKADWGYNAISNGGNTENIWRTPKHEEWRYLFDLRTTPSGCRYAKATVNGVPGMMVFPDDWQCCYYPIASINGRWATYEANVFTMTEWSVLEQYGVMFLPAAGFRNGTSVSGVGSVGLYWSSSMGNNDNSWCFYFYQDNFFSQDYYSRYEGYPVRLVRPLVGELPQVTTSEAENITSSSASCGGVVVSGGGQPVIERGVCWSTNHNPTISGGHLLCGVGTGSFSVDVTDRLPNTTYYVRAYATNVIGTAYGNEVSFTTLSGGGDTPGDDNLHEGAINGLFSVSNNQQVLFSQGNLQYMASTNTWRFAEHQWDYIGGFNINISPTFFDWIDLFGWGTSGFNHGALCYQPWSTSTDNSQYYAYGDANCNLFDQSGMADWGYNAISNGGNATHLWRTLTYQEWNYVVNTRVTLSGIRWTRAKVNNKIGIVLLPDDWSAAFYSLNSPNGGNFEDNVISADDWVSMLEAHGAVFLPAAGYRSGTTPTNVGYWGNYWSATHKGSDDAFYVFFDSRYLDVNYYTYTSRYFGNSVRLVQDKSNNNNNENR